MTGTQGLNRRTGQEGGGITGGGPKHLALLILLGFACPLTPAGHKIMEITDDASFSGLMKHLDKNFYQRVTVIKEGLGHDHNQMMDVVESVDG